MRLAWIVLLREVRIAMRRPAEWIQPLVFYTLIASLFPLGLDPQDPALRSFAPAIVWIGALLAALLAVERLFRGDLEDGTLEQFLVADAPLPVLVAAKLLACWLLIAGPLLLAAPIIGYMLGLDGLAIQVLVMSLLLGTPSLLFMGGFAAALTVGAPRAGILLPILVLPLMCPAVIFGGGAVRAAQAGLPWDAPLYFLGAILVLSVTLLPFATAGALRNAVE